MNFKCVYCGKSVDVEGAFCDRDCRIAYLENELAKRRQPKKPKIPICYGRFKISSTIFELYATSSYDAKRRAHELRSVGYECNATKIGKVLFLLPKGKKALIDVTVVTCIYSGKEPPEPINYALMKKGDR